MSTMNETVRNRRVRERLRAADPRNTPAAATIRYDDAEPIPIRIRDLSHWGAGIRLHDPPQTGSQVVLTVDHEGTPLRFRARLKWGGEVAEGEYAAGCEFLTPLGEDFLYDMTESGVLEDEAERRAAWLKAIVRTNSNPTVRHDAEIVNYSDSGVCVASRHAFEPGTQLLVEVNDGHRPRTVFAATVVWERPEDSVSLHGCSFTGESEQTQFRGALDRHMQRLRRQYQPPIDSAGANSARAPAPPPVMSPSGTRTAIGMALFAAGTFLVAWLTFG